MQQVNEADSVVSRAEKTSAESEQTSVDQLQAGSHGWSSPCLWSAATQRDYVEGLFCQWLAEDFIDQTHIFVFCGFFVKKCFVQPAFLIFD